MNKDFIKYARSERGIPTTTMEAIIKNHEKSEISAALNHPMMNGVDVNIESARTPYILEERQMRFSQMDVFSRLMAERILWTTGVVNDYMCDVITAQMLYLSTTSSDDIKMYIHSPGGSVYHGLMVVDTVQMLQDQGIDIQSLNMGLAASMGSVFLAIGTKGKRSGLKHCRTMLHQSSSGMNGNIQDAEVYMLEWKALNTELAQILADKTGQTLEKVLDTTRRDLWLRAEEAKEYGLIEEIVGRK